MYGLIMLGEYLDEILDGLKKFDARAYYTKIRGTIALIDSRKSKVIGLVDLVNVHEISSVEFVAWHKTSNFKNISFNCDMNKKYWAYDFCNPRRLAFPIKVNKSSKSWVALDDNITKHFFIKSSLF